MPQEPTGKISPLLRLLAESADARRSPDHPEVAAALLEFGQLARLQIPARGVLPLSDDQLFDAIDRVAVAHLKLGAAREQLEIALAQLETLSSRDQIEVAVDHISAVLNIAYFNAGLAFGLTLADLRSL